MFAVFAAWTCGGALACAEPNGDSGASESLGSCEDTLEARTPDELILCNQLGQSIRARVALPETAPPPGGWPGIVLLHGSAGLFRPGPNGCSDELHSRFTEWAQLLTDRGYAVIMPASFSSRGFCEFDDLDPDEEDELERLVNRAFDAAAATNWLCAQAKVDCRRLGVLGFSNGASVALLVMHEQLSDAEDPRLAQLRMPRLVTGVAYYPGCGLDSQLANRLEDDLRDRFYFPTGPVWVPHASKDHLVDRCKDLRDPQVDSIAEERGVSTDMFELHIYHGAKHGFDVYDDWDPKANLRARDDAQVETLAHLARYL